MLVEQLEGQGAGKAAVVEHVALGVEVAGEQQAAGTFAFVWVVVVEVDFADNVVQFAAVLAFAAASAVTAVAVVFELASVVAFAAFADDVVVNSVLVTAQVQKILVTVLAVVDLVTVSPALVVPGSVNFVDRVALVVNFVGLFDSVANLVAAVLVPVVVHPAQRTDARESVHL